MPFINIPEIISKDYGFLPLDRTWYEAEVVTPTTETFRFAKRTDHTGILIQIDMDEFLKAQSS